MRCSSLDNSKPYATIHVVCESISGDTDHNVSFAIDTVIYHSIARSIFSFSKIDNSKAMIGPGKDGTECEISYDTGGDKILYRYWSPDYETNERGLSDFLNTCKQIIIAAKLAPKDIL